jgi:hypothetical protein
VLLSFQLTIQTDDAKDSDLAASTAGLMGFCWEAVMVACQAVETVGKKGSCYAAWKKDQWSFTWMP